MMGTYAGAAARLVPAAALSARLVPAAALSARLVPAAALAALLGPLAAADEAVPDLRDVLGRPVIEPARPLEEIKAYLRSRVRPLPRFDSDEAWIEYSEDLRREILDRVVFRGEARRWRDAETQVEWLETIEGGAGYRIRKLRYEALPGLWIPALLYEPEVLEGRVAAVLNVNGHDGRGKASPYKQVRCINQARRGMLALNVEWLGMGQLRTDGFVHYRMNQIDLCGTSGLSVFYLALERAIDLLLAHEHADPDRLAVTGLSGGGWQTIVISALDTRVSFANPVAGYSSFATRIDQQIDLGDSEQAPTDLGTLADYAHLTALLAPRFALLTYNAEDDCCFRAETAIGPLLAAAHPVYRLLGCLAHIRDHVNYEPGTHNFERENREVLYDSLGYFFHFGDRGYSAEELPCEDEIRSAEELAVELPPGNLDFHALAQRLAAGLPRGDGPPGAREQAAAWRREARARLRELVRARDLAAVAVRVRDEEHAGFTATSWRLELDGVWTLPAVELSPPDPAGTVLLVADGGRGEAAPLAREFLALGRRVVALDPFYHGESKIEGRDFLYALQLNCHGDRPVGLQASQIAAAARWVAGARGFGPVTLAARGPRLGVAALIATALETRAVAALRIEDGLGSLHDVIERDLTAREAPELFCFGLLEAFDVPTLAELAGPRPVELRLQAGTAAEGPVGGR